MRIPGQCIDQLRSVGLLVSPPYVPDHIAYPDGVCVGKPQRAGGHSLPDFVGYWADGDLRLDAPTLYLHTCGSRWFVTSHDYVPGPGPGDFIREFASPEEAVSDILDFYFGDPARMALKRNAGHSGTPTPCNRETGPPYGGSVEV
jgi:hypothetical protein